MTGDKTAWIIQAAQICLGLAALPAALDLQTLYPRPAQLAMGAGTNAKAAAYIELRVNGGRALHGIGIDENLTTASFRALFSALNRALSQAESQAA